MVRAKVVTSCLSLMFTSVVRGRFLVPCIGLCCNFSVFGNLVREVTPTFSEAFSVRWPAFVAVVVRPAALANIDGLATSRVFILRACPAAFGLPFVPGCADIPAAKGNRFGYQVLQHGSSL